MKLPTKSRQGFTLIELLVVIAIIAILASLAVPAITGALTKGQLTQTVNNGKQLLTQSLSMANDFTVQSDTKLGWPGDLKDRTDSAGSSVSGFLSRLVEYDYLKSADLIKLTAAPGVTPWDGNGNYADGKDCAFKIYTVRDGDSGAALFCATANYTYNTALVATAKPYGDKGFVVVRKGGDGTAFKKQQYDQIRNIGLLPGRADFQDKPEESTGTDTLAQN